MASYSSHFSVRRLWTILAASMLVMFGTLLYFGRADLPGGTADPDGRTNRGRRYACSRGSRSSAARTFGNRSAGCSRAPSGGTAAMSRPIGRPIGCIAKRKRCSIGSRAKNAAPPTRSSRAPEQARLRAMLRQAMRTNTYDAAVRRAHDHGRSGSRDRARRRALFRPFPCRLAATRRTCASSTHFRSTRHSRPRNRPR